MEVDSNWILFYNNDIENENIQVVAVKLKVIWNDWIDMEDIDFFTSNDSVI